MRRLSVTEYLIAQNQAQTTVTTYAHIGDALNAITSAADVTPEGEEAVQLYYQDPHEVDFNLMTAPDGAAFVAQHEVHCYTLIGYLTAWRLADRRIVYTVIYQ